MSRRFICLSLALLLRLSEAHGHSTHPPAETDPASQATVCERMVDVAIGALADRDKGKPPRVYEMDGTRAPAIANQIVQAVYNEPAISSPKRAAPFGRVRCQELWGD